MTEQGYRLAICGRIGIDLGVARDIDASALPSDIAVTRSHLQPILIRESEH